LKEIASEICSNEYLKVNLKFILFFSNLLY
jgi:hypothetical protein